ncbi:hypothetical protein [Paenibacillus popilliae]|nr:hypothetical protein [Paenibacillus popilliae]
MFAYLKGAGASAFVATVCYFLLFISTVDWSRTNTMRTDDLGIIFTTVYSYIGCILGWLLLKLLTKLNIKNIWVSLISYAILGFIFALIISSIYGPLLIGAILFTVAGSVSFYLAQKIHSIVLSWTMVLIGPIAAYITFYYFSYL